MNLYIVIVLEALVGLMLLIWALTLKACIAELNEKVNKLANTLKAEIRARHKSDSISYLR